MMMMGGESKDTVSENTKGHRGTLSEKASPAYTKGNLFEFPKKKN
jgi:hypothetical protein